MKLPYYSITRSGNTYEEYQHVYLRVLTSLDGYLTQVLNVRWQTDRNNASKRHETGECPWYGGAITDQCDHLEQIEGMLRLAKRVVFTDGNTMVPDPTAIITTLQNLKAVYCVWDPREGCHGLRPYADVYQEYWAATNEGSTYHLMAVAAPSRKAALRKFLDIAEDPEGYHGIRYWADGPCLMVKIADPYEGTFPTVPDLLVPAFGR